MGEPGFRLPAAAVFCTYLCGWSHSPLRTLSPPRRRRSARPKLGRRSAEPAGLRGGPVQDVVSGARQDRGAAKAAPRPDARAGDWGRGLRGLAPL
eukprot:scaffold801_cov296-Prasinococcus_capsulatus_cf.AAC.4